MKSKNLAIMVLSMAALVLSGCTMVDGSYKDAGHARHMAKGCDRGMKPACAKERMSCDGTRSSKY